MPRTLLLLSLLAWASHGVSPPSISAHPLLSRVYERTIVVRAAADHVTVDYQLDLDENTAIIDLLAALDRDQIPNLKTSTAFDNYRKVYAPILADNLVATLDGKALAFTCVESLHEIRDHLRCLFRFRADWNLEPKSVHAFKFEDGTFPFEVGKVDLTMEGDPSVALSEIKQPSAELKNKPALERTPKEDLSLREAGAILKRVGEAAQEEPLGNAGDSADSVSSRGIFNRLFDPNTSLWMMVGLAMAFGALHALQPGHGKTLVAAYLVGERGTIWHAFFLGLITTLTHTGAVLVLAASIWFFFPRTKPLNVQMALGLVSGIVVAGMGCWLFLKRVAGEPDHIHIGGGHHHHHGLVPEAPSPSGNAGKVSFFSLMIIGITGGIVPCGEAWALFAYSVKFEAWIAPVIQLAFSAGLASVLVAIGVLVVKAKGLAGARWETNRLFRALPLASAGLVTIMGLWLCYESLHP